MSATCPECGAPLGEDMLPTKEGLGCWYFDQYEERMRRDGRSDEDVAAFRRSGADAPCSGYAYDKSRSSRARERFRGFLISVAVLTAAVVIVWLWR